MSSVKEARTNSSEGVSPNRCPIEQQHGPGCQCTTAKERRRRKRSQVIDQIVMKCYYSSNPYLVGYIKRMHMTWKEKRMFDVKEQQLLDQKWHIVTNRWFSDLVLNEIKEKSMGVTKKSDENDYEGSVGFGEEDKVMCEKVCHVVLEDACLNQGWYSDNDKYVEVNRLVLEHGAVLEEDENKIFEQLIMLVHKREKEQLKSLRGIPKAKVVCAVNKFSCMLKKTVIRNLIELNNTMHAAAAYVSELAGASKLPKTKKGPW